MHMYMSTMAFVGGNGRDRRPPLGPRYDPTPNCTCGMKADIRVVENRDKPTWGQLYYCCPNFPSTEVYHCKYFMWCNPRNAGVGGTNEETDGQNREQGGMYVPASWVLLASATTLLLVLLIKD